MSQMLKKLFVHILQHIFTKVISFSFLFIFIIIIIFIYKANGDLLYFGSKNGSTSKSSSKVPNLLLNDPSILLINSGEISAEWSPNNHHQFGIQFHLGFFFFFTRFFFLFSIFFFFEKQEFLTF